MSLQKRNLNTWGFLKKDLISRITTVTKNFYQIISKATPPRSWLYYFYNVNYLLTILLLSFIPVATGQTTGWTSYPVSGSVQVYYPAHPGELDTMGQHLFFLKEGKDMMLTTVAPIPKEVLRSDTFNTDTLISRFIADIITDATPLIYTDITFKDQQAKFYKVRVDNELNPLKGLIVDSYTLLHRDTLYSFSYWRYDASELYDYSKQRMFFDMIRISAEPADTSSAISPVTQQNIISSTRQKGFLSGYWLFIVIAIAVAGGAGYMYYRNQRW